MCTPLFLYLLALAQIKEEAFRASAPDGLEAIFERASKERDFDGAVLVLSSLLSDESTLRSAFFKSSDLDERSVYILFGGLYGSGAKIGLSDPQVHRIMVESISARPALIRPAIRASRYWTYDRKRHPLTGLATINYFPFFSHSEYVDDLLEIFIETLRKETSHPAKDVMHPFNESLVIRTADQVEVNLLGTWQLVCGISDRLDLIDKATTKYWRDRFPQFDTWFCRNRPYFLWDDGKSCVRIDEEAKRLASPTPRKSRSIPELKPSWLSGTR
jgi:hypothetical protein